MRQVFTVLLALTGCFLAVYAQEKNLIANGVLDSGTSEVPSYWYHDSGTGISFPDGGPDNMGYMLFSASEGNNGKVLFRQNGLNLVPGEKYLLSCKIRTRNFRASQPRLLIHDFRWGHEFNVGRFPENTDWQEFFKEFILSEDCRKGEFGAALFLPKFQGELAIADIRLVPLTKKAAEGSSNCLSRIRQMLILEPMTARLEAIPAGTRTLPLFWSRGNDGSTLLATVDGKKIPDPAFRDGCFQLPLESEGRHSVKIQVMHQEKTILEKEFVYAIAVPEKKTAEKRLNSFTTELMSEQCRNAKAVSFTVPRHTWVYFKFETASPVQAVLSGSSAPLLTEKSVRKEIQRRLEAGEYTITFRQPFTGKLVLRTVPVLYKYAGINPCVIPGIAEYDLAWHEKYVFGVFNTIGARGVPENMRAYAASAGVECADNIRPPARDEYNKNNIKAFRKKLTGENSKVFKPSSQWVEFDEFFWNCDEGLMVAAYAFPAMKNPQKKDFLHWFGGTSGPSVPGFHHKAVSAFMNAGGGRGYIAYEAYFKSRPSEAEAAENIQHTLKTAAARMNEFVPHSNGAFGFIFGNFHQHPVLSLDFYPGVNYKYFLDMQFQAMASEPQFNGIALAGFWGFNYANEEIARWCCALIRHYVLEGKTELLSGKYGYTYLLTHVRNGDFEDGLNGWTVQGDVKTGRHLNFGSLSEGRWGATGIGDRFAVFTGHGKQENSLTQEVVGLFPGRPYVLEFITADYDDVCAGKNNPREIAVSAELPGAGILKDFRYADQRNKRKNASVNYRYVRFVPSGETQKLIFRDSGRDGEKLLVNFIRVAPYFED